MLTLLFQHTGSSSVPHLVQLAQYVTDDDLAAVLLD
jgi:hypothetical protein